MSILKFILKLALFLGQIIALIFIYQVQNYVSASIFIILVLATLALALGFLQMFLIGRPPIWLSILIALVIYFSIYISGYRFNFEDKETTLPVIMGILIISEFISTVIFFISKLTGFTAPQSAKGRQGSSNSTTDRSRQGSSNSTTDMYSQRYAERQQQEKDARNIQRTTDFINSDAGKDLHQWAQDVVDGKIDLTILQPPKRK